MRIEKSFEHTIVNLELHLNESNYNFIAKSFAGNIPEDTVQYIAEANYCVKGYIKYIVDKSAELLTIAFYPSLCVPPEYAVMASQYITSVNNEYKYGVFCMSDANGAVSAQVTQSFSYHSVSIDHIKTMELLVSQMCLDKYKELNAVAHGQLIFAERYARQVTADVPSDTDEITETLSEILDDVDDMYSTVESKSEELSTIK